MTLSELLFFALAVGGFFSGIILGAQHTWWWAVLGAPLGVIAGIASYFVIMIPLMFIAIGPRDLFAHTLPRNPRQEHKGCTLK